MLQKSTISDVAWCSSHNLHKYDSDDEINCLPKKCSFLHFKKIIGECENTAMLAINRCDQKEKVSLFELYLGDLGNLSGIYCSAVLGRRHSAPGLLSRHRYNMKRKNGWNRVQLLHQRVKTERRPTGPSKL